LAELLIRGNNSYRARTFPPPGLVIIVIIVAKNRTAWMQIVRTVPAGWMTNRTTSVVAVVRITVIAMMDLMIAGLDVLHANTWL